jgi:superoxide dismutase, Cu-Zn family
VHIVIDVVGAPAGLHGVYVHDATSCSEIDAVGFGRHYNPDRTQHGDPRDAARSHAGDLGNIEVDARGNGRLEFTTSRFSLEIGERDIVRRVITISESPDDLVSQPFGASGPVIACGVIHEDR